MRPSTTSTNMTKSLQLHNQIRRKFIDQMYKKQRQNLNKAHNPLSQPPKQPQTAQLTHLIQTKNISLLYQTLSSFDNLNQIIQQCLWQPIIKLCMQQQNITKYNSMQLLSLIVLHCCSNYVQNVENKNRIVLILEKYQVCKKVYRLACESVNHQDVKLTKLYLYFLKNCALTRIQAVRQKGVVEEYLPVFMRELLGEPSVMILMTFIGEQKLFPPNIIAQICNRGLSQPQSIKIITSNTLFNYIALETDPNNIFLLFDYLLATLQHLYMNCNKYNSSLGGHILLSIKTLIIKYPENREKQLLQRIKNNKLHQLLILLLDVASGQATKQKVYEIQELIVEKCVENLGVKIFQEIPMQIIMKFIEGLEYSSYDIVGTCLKVLLKLCAIADQQIIQQMYQKQLDYVIQNLTYHKNDYIQQTAQLLLPYFQRADEDNNQMAQQF